MEKQERMRKIGVRKLRQMLPWAMYVVPLGEQDFYLVAAAETSAVKCVVPKNLPVGADGEPFIPGYFQPLYDYDLQIMLKDNRLRVMMATGTCCCREREDGEKEVRFRFQSPRFATQQLWVGSYPREGASQLKILFESFVAGAERWEMPRSMDEERALSMALKDGNNIAKYEGDMKYDLLARGGYDDKYRTAEVRCEAKERQIFRIRMMTFVQEKERHDGYIASLSPVRMIEATERAMAVEIFGITRWYPISIDGYMQLVQTVATAEHLVSELKRPAKSVPSVSFDSDEKYVDFFGE